MAKKCMNCGGATKMKKGGSTLSKSAIKKAPVNIFGIPQQNMGTSGQYGMMKTGGATKAKFAASVPVQRSPKAGRVRSHTGVGTVPIGTRKKTGGVTKKYQDGSEVSIPSPSAKPRTFADVYAANLKAGLSERQAKKIAMVESGVKEPKKRIDPNAVINAVGNTAGAIGNAMRPSTPFQKKGGSIKKGYHKMPNGKLMKGTTHKKK